MNPRVSKHVGDDTNSTLILKVLNFVGLCFIALSQCTVQKHKKQRTDSLKCNNGHRCFKEIVNWKKPSENVVALTGCNWCSLLTYLLTVWSRVLLKKL